MGRILLIDVSSAIVFLLTWYLAFLHYNRRRGTAVLQWIQNACLGRGKILSTDWERSSSVLIASLQLPTRWFEDSRVTVRLLPRALPVSWLVSRARKQAETLTFEADMDFPPGFHMDVIRHRWAAHTAPKTVKSRSWSTIRTKAVVLTTREDWPTELTPVVHALTAWREKDFLSVRFNQTSPHFTATVELQSLSDEDTAVGLLGLFRELAASSSAKQH